MRIHVYIADDSAPWNLTREEFQRQFSDYRPDARATAGYQRGAESTLNSTWTPVPMAGRARTGLVCSLSCTAVASRTAAGWRESAVLA